MLSEASPAGNWALGITVAFTLVATLFVALRFWARNTTRFGLWLDDWLALATLVVLYWVLIISAIAVDKGGIGKPIAQAMAEDSLTLLLQLLWAFEWAYLFGSPLMKLMVLAFYWRMFPGKTIRLAIAILSGICGVWFVGTFFGNILQCAPISKFWDLTGTQPGVCHFTATMYYVVVAIPNMVIDLATVALPIYEIWSLQLVLWKRIGVCIVFLLGGIVVVASIVRLALLVEFNNKGTANVSEDLLLPWFVTVIEIGVAIIGACVPCLMPLYRKIRYGTADNRATPGYQSTGKLYSKGTPSRSKSVAKQFLGSNDGVAFERMDSQKVHTRTIVRRGSQIGEEDSDEIPLQGINITREVVIKSSSDAIGHGQDPFSAYNTSGHTYHKHIKDIHIDSWGASRGDRTKDMV